MEIALIDTDLVHTQFDGLPDEVIAEICAAFASDLRETQTAVLSAVDRGDDVAMRRARHSLTGLCGNFGADRVVALAGKPLIAPAERAALHEAIEQTIAAVRGLLQ